MQFFLMSKVLPPILYVFLITLKSTLRIQHINNSPLDEASSDSPGFIVCFWHSRLLMMPFARKWGPVKVLISRHRDGEFIARVIQFFKVGTIRGSYQKISLSSLREIINNLKTGIDIAAGTCNRLRLYKDVPGWFDAWDIDSIYKLQPVEIPAAAEIHVGAEGPIFASRTVRRKFGKPELSQEIVLRAGSRRLDFRTVVEWRESHKLLKVNFPVNVRSEDALHEIQFGHIRRPTHSSKQYDADKFEVCNYKWTALAEENRGAAVLNDCKYGVNVEKNSINLTLLKSALAPDMTADKGRQEFTYSFYFWEGPLASSRVVQESYDLNVPLSVEDGAAGRRELFGTDSPSVIVETVKPAEDGSGDIVVRLYESARSSVDCEFRTSLPVKTAAETDMLEREKRKLKLSSGAVNLSFRPFEIKTLRLKVG